MSLVNCPECKKQVSDQAKQCPNCGYSLPKPKIYITCPECEAKVEQGNRICSNCGYPFEGKNYLPDGKKKLLKKLPLLVIVLVLVVIVLITVRVVNNSDSFYIQQNNRITSKGSDPVEIIGSMDGNYGVKLSLQNHSIEDKEVNWVITKNNVIYGFERCYLQPDQELQLVSDDFAFGLNDESEGVYKFVFYDGKTKIKTLTTKIEKKNGAKRYVGFESE